MKERTIPSEDLGLSIDHQQSLRIVVWASMSRASDRGKHAQEKTTSSSLRNCSFISNVTDHFHMDHNASCLPPPPPQFCITNNHWQKKCEKFGKGKQDALWLMWKWWIGLLMVETSFYPHKYNFSCWRLSWLSGRSGSPDVDHVDERFFSPCEKQLSRLWEKQIGSSHLDVWKIESKITVSVWWREGSRNRDSTVYNITF